MADGALSAAAKAAKLRQDITACTICADHLPQGPRPIVQFSPHSRLCLIGQAPGSKVHKSGIPWDDDSGDRLRVWLNIGKDVFYNPDKIALIPMGFCYPGAATGGDKPPRPECAPHWHSQVLALLPENRITVLIGTYAQSAYLPEQRNTAMTERVRCWTQTDAQASAIPLPHPAWRSRIWMAKHPWFERCTLPMLRRIVAKALSD